ncbi:MAG: hypothetical protein ACJ714_16005 [Ornithinibacter sp.]
MRMPDAGWPRPARTHAGVLALLVGGAALLLLGVGLVAVERFIPLAPAEFGWLAYADAGGGSAPTFVVVTTRELWGLAAGVLGLAALAAGVGFVLGGRRRPRAP